MVKFGETIEMDRRPEWIDGYVDYAGLKALLKKMEAAGTIRECARPTPRTELPSRLHIAHTGGSSVPHRLPCVTAPRAHRFSEHTVYKAFSVASDSNLLQCHAPREVDFTKKIDTEIAKVNKFADGLRKQLLARFDLAQHQHEAWIEAGSNEAGLAALNQVMLECSEALQNFEDFININYLAFSKILKKHDKLSSCPCRAPYLLRIQRETFARQCLPELIKGISDLHASLVVRSSQPGTPEQTREDSTPEDAEKKKKGGVFDSAQKGGTTFIRSTRKYWVATADVLKVKTFLLRRLPVYKVCGLPLMTCLACKCSPQRSRLPVYKFTDGATDSDLVTSIYFDSPGRQLYEGRLKKFDGAIALRVRWYGPTPAHDDIVYMERKVHREGTPCTGPSPRAPSPSCLSTLTVRPRTCFFVIVSLIWWRPFRLVQRGSYFHQGALSTAG